MHPARLPRLLQEREAIGYQLWDRLSNDAPVQVVDKPVLVSGECHRQIPFDR
jgi:hypothetical protein